MATVPVIDYATLVTAAVNEAWRKDDADFLAGIPAALMALEDGMMLGSEELEPLRIAEMLQRNVTVALTDGVGDLPADCLELARVRYAGRADLDIVDVTWLDDAYPVSQAGLPLYAAVDGRKLLVQPASATSVTINYYARLPTLLNGANWLVAKAPSVYLYGLLTHMAPQMLEDQRMQTWGAMYRAILGGLVTSDRRLRTQRMVARNRGATP